MSINDPRAALGGFRQPKNAPIEQLSDEQMRKMAEDSDPYPFSIPIPIPKPSEPPPILARDATLRDVFALAVLHSSTASSAIMVARAEGGKAHGMSAEASVASMAYELANAMMEERKKSAK